jgi:glycerol-3-phosphate acyltransferase PlsY
MIFIVISALAYLVGSIPFAVIVSSLMGLSDPRTYGSQNPGATNVLRSGNKKAAILTLLGDCFKGWLVVWAVKNFQNDLRLLAVACLFVFIGHIFSLFLRFKGGKGVATALGVLLGLNLWLGLSVLGVWVLVFILFRYSSLSALISAFSAPILAYFFLPNEASWLMVVLIIMTLILIYRHKKNIIQLFGGKEDKMRV